MVISGMTSGKEGGPDWNDNFKGITFGRSRKKIGDFQCKVFDSWAQADGYISGIKTDGKKNDRDQLLIVELAHGGPKGSAHCNAGVAEPEEILGDLRKYRKRFHVGAILKSCYTGDLLKEMLKVDALYGKKDEIENLCLITASVFGRIASTEEDVLTEEPKPGENMEEYLLRYPDGDDHLISSSAWDSAGVTRYLLRSDAHRAARAIRGLNRIAKGAVCTDQEKEFFDFCSSPLSESEINLLKEKDRLSRTDVLGQDYELLIKRRKEIVDPKKAACIDGYLASFDPHKLTSTVGRANSMAGSLDAIEKEFSDFRKTDAYRKCIESEAESKGLVDGVKLELQHPIFSSYIDSLLFPSMSVGPAITARREWVRVASEYFNTDDLNEVIPENLPKLMNESPVACRDRRKNPGTKAYLGDVIGESLSSDEQESTSNNADRKRWRGRYYPPQLLQLHRNGSAKIERLKSKRDRWRRKACRDFTF